ncbi:MAG: tRNA preQ1(34) S-adenosylmethionine ribosyltransferase-isomerase QueA [Candidatus Melainabacteria bacterium GWF2_37_15]|nr:MAG: tRNA preQ1(34) S-adenosylmethionine ribosyltransferase-isomerase QueA [Candidatus Melainabacteria bacterium GWF2_37_15]
MILSEFDYELPRELIAQVPCPKRDNSNLMVLNKADKTIEHRKFLNITEYLSEDDVLVLNNTRVIPARLLGKKATGANIEVFLLEKQCGNIWKVMIKPAKRVKEDTEIVFSEELKARVISKEEVELIYEDDFNEILNRTGNIPLPPYINRENNSQDAERYQTVYAQTPGSVAAPTAGLHFTEKLLKELKKKGVQICYVTLNVGLGTFKPVQCENILEHKIHQEYYEVPETTVNIIKNAKAQGKNIVAVGTTTVRTLETAFAQKKNKGYSELFIYPGYQFQVVDKLITNFHLPKSTLLMLVSAFAEKDFVFKAYREAVEKKYRFFSYGDCMLIF